MPAPEPLYTNDELKQLEELGYEKDDADLLSREEIDALIAGDGSDQDDAERAGNDDDDQTPDDASADAQATEAQPSTPDTDAQPANDPPDTQATQTPAEPASPPASEPLAKDADGWITPPPPLPGEEDPTLPRYDVTAPADLQQKIDAARQARLDAERKYRDGEIDDAERDAAVAKAEEERDQLIEQRATANALNTMAETAMKTAWDASVQRMIAIARDTDGIDYTNRVLGKAFDDAVQNLAKHPKINDLTMMQVLRMAHAEVLQAIGRPAGKAAAPAPAPAPAPARGKAGKAPDLSRVPPVLSTVPAAGPADAGAHGEFAHLEHLEGFALEKELAKLSPEALDRYLEQ